MFHAIYLRNITEFYLKIVKPKQITRMSTFMVFNFFQVGQKHCQNGYYITMSQNNV